MIDHHVSATTSRRRLLAGGLVGLGALAAGCAARPAPAPVLASPARPDVAARFAAIEAGFGRLGVFALDTATGATVGHRADERFLLCSTSKMPTVATVLRARLSRPGLLDVVVRYGRDRVVRNSPVTAGRVATGMTVAQLCAAAITMSDNTAENLLLDQVGGPAGVQAFARSVGDTVSHFDRPEPALNSHAPGDPGADTTTPAAIAGTLRACALGDALDPPGRDMLVGWLVANTTGGTRIRAGLPAGWRTADKTGSGDHGEVNDVAVTWPPGRAPIVITVYTEPADPSSDANVAAVPAAASAACTALLAPA